MNNIDILLVFLLPIICFILVILSFKYDKKFASINFVLFCIYSTILYGLAWVEGGHGAILWSALTIILNFMQILVVGIFVIVMKSEKNSTQ